MANLPKDRMIARARMLYATNLMRKGWSNSQIVNHLKEKDGISESAARNTIKKAYDWLRDNEASGYVESVRRKQVERSEWVLQQAIEARNWKAANSILDNLNKLLGLYEQKQKLEIVGDEIKFKFGAESQPELKDGNQEN